MLRTKFNGYSRDGRRVYFLDMGGNAPPAPDYTPMANASKESAEIMAALGREQLDESRHQYERNLEVAQPVVDAQLDTMRQTKDQGDDYFDYMKTYFRPTEQAAAAEAMKAGSEAEQEVAAGKAIADVRRSATAATNMAIRQGLRYGLDPVKISKLVADNGIGLASAEAAGANSARTQEKQIGWAKKLDVAGMGRGLPGASQGAYSLATGAGNSAVQNTMAPGQALIAGMGQGAATVGQGRQLLQSGLAGILNAQTGYANTIARGDDGFGSTLGGLGAIGQGLGAMKTAGFFAGSSKKLKTAKHKTGAVLRGVRNLDIEDWRYKKGVADGGMHTGPYAEDVRREFGDKAAPGGKVIDMISMQGIMLKAIQELADKVDGKKRRVIDGKARRVA